VTTIKVTTTPAFILRSAIELATEGPDGETRWERQARTLDELGYAIVGKDDAADLPQLRERVFTAEAERDQAIADCERRITDLQAEFARIDRVRDRLLRQLREQAAELDAQLTAQRRAADERGRRVAELEPIAQRAREVRDGAGDPMTDDEAGRYILGEQP